MKSILIQLLLTCTTLTSLGATDLKIKGRVFDKANKPVAKANIAVRDAYDGATSDAQGHFDFTTERADTIYLIVSHPEYEADTLTIIPHLKKEVSQDVLLKRKESIMLQEVVVSASSLRTGAGDKVALNQMDVYTNPLGNADLSMAFRSTPGLQQVDSREGFFIRGGESREAVVTINGIVIKNFFSDGIASSPGRGRFETGTFQGMSLSTGGYSVRNGNALSGALELNLTDIPAESNLFIGLSPIFASLGGGKVFKGKKSYLEGSITYANPSIYMPLFLKKGWHFKAPDNNVTSGIKGVFNLTPDDRLDLLAQINVNRMGMLHDSEGLFKVKSDYAVILLAHRHELSPSSYLRSGVGISYDYSSRLFTPASAPFTLDRDLTDRFFTAGTAFFHRYHLLTFEHGFNIQYTSANYTQSLQTAFDNRYKEIQSALYTQATLPLYHNITLEGGLRAEYSSYVSKASLLPRTALTFRLTPKTKLTADWGMYSQTADYLKNHGIVNPHKEQSMQTNITMESKPDKGRLLRLQAFYKDYKHLARFFSPVQPVLTDGKGYARGFDLFWRDGKSIPGTEYWISYSFMDTHRLFADYPISTQPDFAAKHTASFVAKRWFSSIHSLVNVALTYHSGFPYRNPNLPQEQFMSERTPGIFSLNLSYNYPFERKSLKGVVVLTVQNIFNSNPTLGYHYGDTKINNEFPRFTIKSPIGTSVFLGFFINLGVDRRDEIINSHL